MLCRHTVDGIFVLVSQISIALTHARGVSLNTGVFCLTSKGLSPGSLGPVALGLWQDSILK